MKHNLIFTIICLLPTVAVGQDKGIDLVNVEKEVMTYKKLFKHADSLTIRGNVGEISDGLIEIAKSLDEGKPIEYFLKAAEMFEMGKHNDASFLYYMGDLRYRYYNSVNPKYSKSDDGALIASFNYVLGEPVGYYLRANVDNFIEILKKCSDYQETNDYQFYPKKKDPVRYLEQANKLSKAITDLELNKKSYQQTWNKQRTEYEKNMDDFLEQTKEK